MRDWREVDDPVGGYVVAARGCLRCPMLRNRNASASKMMPNSTA
jgi:hypothetical protein